MSVFSPSGKKLQTFGTCGSAQGQLIYPRGVAMDSKGNIFVNDGHNHRIQKFHHPRVSFLQQLVLMEKDLCSSTIPLIFYSIPSIRSCM